MTTLLTFSILLLKETNSNFNVILKGGSGLWHLNLSGRGKYHIVQYDMTIDDFIIYQATTGS